MDKRSPEYKKLVGGRLETIRKALGLRKKQHMADRLGVKHDRYSSWENGNNLLPIEFGLLLAREHKINLDWLYSTDPERTALELAVPRRA